MAVTVVLRDTEVERVTVGVYVAVVVTLPVGDTENDGVNEGVNVGDEDVDVDEEDVRVLEKVAVIDTVGVRLMDTLADDVLVGENVAVAE